MMFRHDLRLNPRSECSSDAILKRRGRSFFVDGLGVGAMGVIINRRAK